MLGLRCAGKTSVGRVLAGLLGVELRDTDRMIELAHGAGISLDTGGAGDTGAARRRAGEILAELGESAFRDLEERALEEALRALRNGGVVATGGGIVERERCRELLAERALCVWLVADLGLLAERLAADPTPRPALFGADAAGEFAALAKRRAPHFARLASVTVDTGARNPQDIAHEIEGELRKRGAI